MLRGQFAAAIGLVICGCVSAPERPPASEPFEAGGLPLSTSDRVGLLVSGEVSPRDPTSGTEIAGLAMGDASAVAQAFTDGFRVHLPEATVGVADDALRANCVDNASKYTEADSIVLAIPGLASNGCHAQAERLGLRYLILIGGARSTTSTFSAQQMGLGTDYSHTMKLRAQVFDTSTGALVCERDRSAFGSSYFGVAFVGGGLGGGPIPVFQVLNEAAYWKHTAWRLGYVVAGCFVQPTAETTMPANAVSDAATPTDVIAGCSVQPAAATTMSANAASDVVKTTDVAFPSAIWWFRRTHRVSGRLLITKGGLVFCERLPSGGEAPYKVSSAEVKSVSLEDNNKQEPMISIYRQDNTAEYFSILRGDSDAIDAEGTQSAYELVKERFVSRAGRYTVHPKPTE